MKFLAKLFARLFRIPEQVPADGGLAPSFAEDEVAPRSWPRDEVAPAPPSAESLYQVIDLMRQNHEAVVAALDAVQRDNEGLQLQIEDLTISREQSLAEVDRLNRLIVRMADESTESVPMLRRILAVLTNKCDCTPGPDSDKIHMALECIARDHSAMYGRLSAAPNDPARDGLIKACNGLSLKAQVVPDCKDWVYLVLIDLPRPRALIGVRVTLLDTSDTKADEAYMMEYYFHGLVLSDFPTDYEICHDAATGIDMFVRHFIEYLTKDKITELRNEFSIHPYRGYVH